MEVLEITLDRQHSMHLQMHNWVKVGNYFVIKENKNEYYVAKLVDNTWSLELDSLQTKAIIKEEN